MGIKLPRKGSSPDDEQDAPPPTDDAGEPSVLDMPDDPDAAVEDSSEGPAEPDPPDGPAADGIEPTPSVPPVIVPRWVQLVLLPLALLGVWALARASGTVLLILVTASVVALMLNPIVQVLERARIRRGFAILLVYLGFFAILVGIGALLSNVISTQISRLQRDVPHRVYPANTDLTNVQS